MDTTNKLFIQIDDEKIELIGTEKEAFIADIKAREEERLLFETEYKDKQDARESAIKKLANIAGLTEKEINSIIN